MNNSVALYRPLITVVNEGVKIVPSLASYLMTSLEMLWLAHQEGLDGYVLWDAPNSSVLYHDKDAFVKQPNMWEWYFDQPFTTVKPEASWCYPSSGLDALYRKYDGKLGFEDFVRQRLRILPSIKAKAEQLLIDCHLNGDDGYVAVSHRGTDKIYEALVTPISCYFPFLDELRNRRMLVIAEEKKILDILLKRYPNAIHVPRFYFVKEGERQMSDWSNPKRGYERGEDVVLMLCLFSQADVLLRNAANLSNLAAMVLNGTSKQVMPNGSVIVDR